MINSINRTKLLYYYVTVLVSFVTLLLSSLKFYYFFTIIVVQCSYIVSTFKTLSYSRVVFYSSIVSHLYLQVLHLCINFFPLNIPIHPVISPAIISGSPSIIPISVMQKIAPNIIRHEPIKHILLFDTVALLPQFVHSTSFNVNFFIISLPLISSY